MLDNILLTDTDIYVNHRLPCLKEYRESLYIVKLKSATDDIEPEIRVIDVSEDAEELDMGKTGYESWQYLKINKHKNKITDLFMDDNGNHLFDKDIVMLGDLNEEVLYLLDIFQKSRYQGQIHLILPVPFEKTIQGTLQNEILSNLSKVRTMAVYDPYKLAVNKYGNTDVESLGKIIDEQTRYLLEKLNDLLKKMMYQLPTAKYFFDFEKNSYIDTESLEILDEYQIQGTLGLMFDGYSWYINEQENDYVIDCMRTPVPRPDGKQICEQLRSIRKEFAKLNKIDYKFAECSYNGPCAGTCRVCDKEARDLEKIAKELKGVKYPQMLWEDPYE